MEKMNFIKIENGNEDSENILSISEKEINYNLLSKKNDNYLEAINYKISLLYEIYENNLIKSIDKSIQDKIISYFNQIYSILNLLSKEKNNIISQYESILRKNEEKIRSLFSDIFNLKIRNTYLENNVEILLKKEDEYKLIKEKTGIIVENGSIIYNDRKDNEIFILRQENSNLKTVVNKNEIELNEFKKKYEKDKINFQEKINKLNSKISLLKNKLQQNESKQKIKSASNIKLVPSIEKNKINYKNNNSSFKKATSLKKVNNKVSLNHSQSSCVLNLKNKISNQANVLNNKNKSKIPFLNLTNITKTDNCNKKLLYLTPRNQINDIKICTYQNLGNKTGEKRKVKNKTIDNNTLINKSKRKNINNTINDAIPTDILKSKTVTNKRAKIPQRKINVKNQFSWTQNFQINNPLITSSPLKINKIYVLNNHIRKISKDKNLTTNLKKNEYIKRKRNMSNHLGDNSYDILNKLNLTSLIKKNMAKNSISNHKTNFIVSTNKNK